MKKLYKTKRKIKGQVFLEVLSKPLAAHQTKVCSIKSVCGGVPLPNNRSHFYDNCSACIECTREISKRKWEQKKKDDLFFGN